MLVCPHCEVDNNIFGDEDSKNMVIIDKEKDLYQCFSCLGYFDEGESLDFEWERMCNRFAKDISPEKCIKWFYSSFEDKPNLQKSTLSSAGIPFGSFGYEQAFLKHFGILYSKATKEDMINIKRDLKINNILDENF